MEVGSETIAPIDGGFFVARTSLLPQASLAGISTRSPSEAWAYVREITESPPITNKIRPKDEIFVVDNGDVWRRSVLGVSNLLAQKSRQAWTKIARRDGGNINVIDGTRDVMRLKVSFS